MFRFTVFHKDNIILSGLCDRIADFVSNDESGLQNSVQFYLEGVLVGKMVTSGDDSENWSFSLDREISDRIDRKLHIA